MDFENIIYLVGGIIYLLYSASKGAKKHKENRPGQSRPKPEQREEDSRSSEEKIREMLDRKREELQKENHRPMEEAMESRESFQREHRRQQDIIQAQRQAEQRAKEAEERMRQINERYSAELEDSLLEDDVTIKTLDRKTSRPARGYRLVRNGRFNARKAFVYSEIFNRKY